MNGKYWTAGLILATAAPAAFCCDEGGPTAPRAVPACSQPGLETIRDHVTQRCELSSRISRNKLPWYFHYESGVKHLKQGEKERALLSFQMTANLRPEPARMTRMYGMWFVDYLPFYQLSRAYIAMEEWSMAWHALMVSECLQEIHPQNLDSTDFAALKALVQARLGLGD